jgi:hypothetical protein
MKYKFSKESRKRMSEAQKARWAALKNGASPSNERDEIEVMREILASYHSLKGYSQEYIRQRISK